MYKQLFIFFFFIILFSFLTSCSSIKYRNYGTNADKTFTNYQLYNSDIINGFIFSTGIKVQCSDLESDIYLSFLNRNFAYKCFITNVVINNADKTVSDIHIEVTLRNKENQIIIPKKIDFGEEKSSYYKRLYFSKDQLKNNLVESIQIEYIKDNIQFYWEKEVALKYVDYVSVWDAWMSI